MNRLTREINFKRQQGRHGQYEIFQGMSSGNVLGEFYWQLSMGRKDTIFGRVLPEETAGRYNV